MRDEVNHPAHYETSHPGMECIELTESLSFCLGNAVKYVWRCHSKNNETQDLRKAAWYLHRARLNHEPAPGLTPRQHHILDRLRHDADQADRLAETDFWHSLQIGRLDTAGQALSNMILYSELGDLEEDLQ